jgi:hypothetical protein
MAKRGPQTEAGRLKCAQVKTVHGKDTRAIQAELSRIAGHLEALETLGHEIGLLSRSKTAGRKSAYYYQAQQQLLAEIDLLLHTLG